MLNIIIFGAPGSGKGTQSELLIEKYGFDHVSTGDLLRQAIKDETELGKLAKSYMDAGRLVPDELIIGLIETILEVRRPKVGLMFDGFPRTIAQAQALAILLNEYGTAIHAVLNLQVEEAELIERLLKRGADSGRSDDNLETIKKRLDVYKEQTYPLVEYYTKEGVHYPLVGTGAIEDITGRISDVVDKLKG